MKPSTRIESIASRAYRGAVLVGSIAVAFSCSDQPPVAPRQVPPGFARMSVKPVYQTTVSGGPTIVADKAVGILRGPNGDSVVVTAKFDGDSAVLLFDVPITGSSARFTLDLTEFDASGQSVYHGTQEYTLKPGNNDGLAPPVLVYSAPDAKLAFLHVSPSSALLNSGASTGFAVSGTTSSGQSVSPIHVGWTTKNATIATVDDNGVVIAGKFQSSTYIIARTVLGLADSAIVTVHAPVDHVVASPASLQLLRGATGAVAAELRDAANNLIDDRSVTWSSGDETIATVTSTGVVQALKIGTTTLTASAEGKVGTVPVTVVSPVDHIELTPSSLGFASLGETQAVSGRIVARTGASVAGLSLTFSSSNAAVASVDNSGTVTANANGSATITASVDGMTATVAVSVQQVPTSISVSPASVITTSLGETRPFLATIVDARGNAVTGVTITWSSSDTHVASISSTGVATANSIGSATLTATAGGKSGSATMYVTQQVASLRLFISNSIAVGQTATLSAKALDARGNLMGNALATWTTSTPNLVTISGDQVTGIAPGTAQITGRSNGVSANLTIVVAPPPPGAMSLTPNPVEKLPNGTQQFVVVNGSGPFTWTVNGVSGGNSTFGTITAGGLYTAPSAVPSPATFDVCAAQASPAAQACSQVTINAVPSSGGEVVVFNDMNLFDDQNGVATGTANQIRFFRNLANYTAAGVRAAQHGFEFFRGHNSLCASEGECRATAESQMDTTLAGAGFTVVNVDDPSATIPSTIDPTIKVILLLNPTVPFTNAEINSLKRFAGEGGRIIFAGEHGGFYGAYIGLVENAFFASMGAQLTNASTIVNCNFGNWVVPASSLRSHQITTGLSGLSIPCASSITPGPNDFPIVYDVTGQFVVGAVAKVDLTPLSTTSIVRMPTKSATRPAQPRTATVPLPAVDGLNRPRTPGPR